MKTKPDSDSNSAPLSRRKFMLASGAAVTAFTVLPRHVLGGPGFVAPSEKITMAIIGCGTQALREMPPLIAMPEVQIVAVCDPVQRCSGYLDWSKDGLRSELAQALGKSDWRRGLGEIPGGRDVTKEFIELYYASRRPEQKFKGCAAYVDFRELLEKEKDVNAVKIMTPDHLHATVAIAAMKKGKHVLMHKPLANRLKEARLVVETARRTRVGTHFLPSSDGANVRQIKSWIDAGAIGSLREIHNWSNRPVWPQYATLPTDRPPVPDGFDWQLWLGPSRDRPYHPHYTHAVFRGWYEFGGGALADMGHYSLWPVFREFELGSPLSVESRAAHICGEEGGVPFRVKNDYSFPAACTVRLKFAAASQRGPVELFWYDGSMRPPTPADLEAQNQELGAEGMMFVGDRGAILAEFRGENPRILPSQRQRDFENSKGLENARAKASSRAAAASWVAAFRGGPATFGDFTLAGPISDAFNLAAVSLRMGGKRLVFDANKGTVGNSPEANKYLTREYRPGWELA